jgi:hypothetical protein
VCYNNTGATQNFYYAIWKYNATTNPRLDLFEHNGPDFEAAYQTSAGSVTDPGSSPNVFTVGAICWSNNAVESYSSRGPTIDNRTKPDIAGQDSVSSTVYGNFSTCGQSGFTGTSASTPVTAGVAALIRQANPSFTPSQLQSYLETHATDLGTSGKDNTYGWGRLTAGPTPLCDYGGAYAYNAYYYSYYANLYGYYAYVYASGGDPYAYYAYVYSDYARTYAWNAYVDWYYGYYTDAYIYAYYAMLYAYYGETDALYSYVYYGNYYAYYAYSNGYYGYLYANYAQVYLSYC